MPAWLTWQAVRLFFGGLWTKAAPFLTRYWREVVIAMLLVALAWWQTGIASRDRQIAALTLQRDGWRKAEEVTRQSNDRLTAALHEQNAAVEGLKADADKRVQAGQMALTQAKDRAAVREGLAARIDAQRAPAGSGADCRTSPAVMAAKGQL